MMEPGRLASIRRRATACAMKNAARTLSAKMASKSSTLTSIRTAGRLVPALLTSTSNGSAAAIVRRTASRSVTSSGSATALSPRAAIACAAASISVPRACGERHLGAGLRERGRRRQPDAAPATGDQRAFAVETKGGCLGQVYGRHWGHRALTPLPGRRARCGRRSGARAHWPVRHGRRSPRECIAASSIRRSAPTLRR